MSKEKPNFKEFLTHCGINPNDLPKLVTITEMHDDSCDMIHINIENVCVQGGNIGDIYNGCISHPYIGEYDNEDEFIDLLKNHILDLGHNVTIKYEDYEYED